MRLLILISALLFCSTINLKAQDQNTMETLPYHQIPEYPESYSAANVMARMIDGLGYRYYWATEDLREEDLSFKVSESSRTSFETIEHIHSLVNTSLKTIKSEPIVRTAEKEVLDFKTMRHQTLNMLKEASDRLRSGDITDLSELKLVFKRDERSSEYEFWHLINGPIADALWHVGQIVSNRRASGNPLDPTVSVFSGKNRARN